MSVLSRPVVAMALVITAVYVNGCGPEETMASVESQTGPIEPSGVFPDSMFYDAWVLEEGQMLADVDPELEAAAFEIEPNGHARVYFHDIRTEVNDCVRAFALFDENTLVFDLARETGLRIHPARAAYFPVVVLGSDFLGLADEAGRIGLFSHQPVPPEATCPPLAVDATWTGLPPPHIFGDLVFWQGDLLYNSTDGNIERFDLATEQLLPPLASTNNRFLISTQGDLFWTHCGCGGSPDAYLQDLNSIYDTVHTGSELDFEITIRAGVFNTASEFLWLHGATWSGAGSYLLDIDASSEPDELIRALRFNRTVNGMTFDGDDLWMIVRTLTQSVARVDDSSGLALQTFEVPDEDASWYGITVDDIGNLYLVGVDGNGQGRIVRASGVTASLRSL